MKLTLALNLGAQLAWSRLGWGGVLPLALAHGAVLIGALLERQADATNAANQVLTGITFGLAIPLLGYFWLQRACGGLSLSAGVQELGRYGPNQRALSAGLIAACMLGLGLGASSLGAMAALASAPQLTRGLADAVTCAWIGFLAGLAYGGWFALASSFGRRGAGRWVALLVDVLLGPSASVAALPLPRAHSMNLLGAYAVQGLAQWVSSLSLLGLGLGYALLALKRTPK